MVYFFYNCQLVLFSSLQFISKYHNLPLPFSPHHNDNFEEIVTLLSTFYKTYLINSTNKWSQTAGRLAIERSYTDLGKLVGPPMDKKVSRDQT